ncbi:MAG: arginyltransferase [Betaproteobacteria bacterium]|nr:arginyltransferase [Betaproteobacteria bacterium]
MNQLNHRQPQRLRFDVSTAYRCGYLPSKLAKSLIVSPPNRVGVDEYDDLIHQGFRRSGEYVYRPHCELCQACVPVRLMVNAFTPSRSQKRAWKQHNGLTIKILPIAFYEEHYQLYTAYQQARHYDPPTNGEHDRIEEDAEQYENFLCKSNVETVLVEFREHDALKMVSVIDLIQNGVSAVYTFYDTTDATSSYGTFNVVWQALWAKQLNLPYLYLGYWIKDSKKMTYKQKYQPLEMRIGDTWIPFHAPQPDSHP